MQGFFEVIKELPMPIEMRDLNGGLGVYFAGRGVITEKEYVDAFTKNLKQDDQKLRKYRYSFADWTAVSKAEISTKAVNFIAKYYSELMTQEYEERSDTMDRMMVFRENMEPDLEKQLKWGFRNI